MINNGVSPEAMNLTTALSMSQHYFVAKYRGYGTC